MNYNIFLSTQCPCCLTTKYKYFITFVSNNSLDDIELSEYFINNYPNLYKSIHSKIIRCVESKDRRNPLPVEKLCNFWYENEKTFISDLFYSIIFGHEMAIVYYYYFKKHNSPFSYLRLRLCLNVLSIMDNGHSDCFFSEKRKNLFTFDNPEIDYILEIKKEIKNQIPNKIDFLSNEQNVSFDNIFEVYSFIIFHTMQINFDINFQYNFYDRYRLIKHELKEIQIENLKSKIDFQNIFHQTLDRFLNFKPKNDYLEEDRPRYVNDLIDFFEKCESDGKCCGINGIKMAESIKNDENIIEKTTWICLNGKQINTLPEAFCLFNNLCTLKITSNNFKEIPSVIYKLKTLKVLDVYGNQLKVLDDRLAALPLMNRISIISNDCHIKISFKLKKYITDLPFQAQWYE